MTATYPTDHPATAPRPNRLVRWTLALERSTAMDGAARLVAPVADALVRSPGRRAALQGRWAGHALHPVLVTLPLGTWTAVSVLDVMPSDAHRETAQTLTGLGVLAALPAAVTGLAEWADTNQRDSRTATAHALANSAALALYTLSWRARRGGRHARGALLAAGALGVSGVGGYLGGHLAQVRKVGSHHPAFTETS
jgi:uncharacterized membrane protein